MSSDSKLPESIAPEKAAGNKPEPAPKTEKPETDEIKIKQRVIKSEQLGFNVLYAHPNPDQIEVDIIAVHGIGADPDWTWKAKVEPGERPGSNKTIAEWLKDEDMLPAAIPRSRIMRFGYDSTWYGAQPVKQRLEPIATDMLHRLQYVREDCENRPIIFIGHCFGGIVIQKAYLLAKANDDDYPGVAASTAGIVFMGTPHRGTGGALHSQGKIYDTIAKKAPHIKIQHNILQTIEGNNEILIDVVRQFSRVSNVDSTRIQIFCFFETKATIVGAIVGDDSIEEFVVDEQSGSLHGHRNQGLPLDHFNLNKFTGPQDGNYTAVRFQLVKMAKKAAELGLNTSRMQQRPIPTSAAAHHRGTATGMPFISHPTTFAPRSNILQTIAGRFSTSLKVALWGPPGSGKTRIAVEYAQHYSASFPGAKVLWVNARSGLEFERSYRLIAESLPVRNTRPDILKALCRHLSQEASGRWLMILDGLDSEDALTAADGLSRNPLLGDVPKSTAGRVLITTRDMSLASSFTDQKSERVIDTGPLSDNDAPVMLYSSSAVRELKDVAKKEAAIRLSRGLAGSPLALSLASAYIQARGAGFYVGDYLQLLASHSTTATAPASSKGNAADAAAVEAACAISYQFLKEQKPEAARRLLEIGALDLQTIKLFLLAKGADSAQQLEEQISVLAQFALIRRSEDGLEIGATSLVQTFAREILRQTDQVSWAEDRLLSLVTSVFPPAEAEGWETCEALHPCAAAVLRFQPKSTAGKRDRAALLQRLAGYLKHLGQYKSAIALLEECIQLREDESDPLAEAAKQEAEAVREEERRAESAPEVHVPAAPSLWSRAVGKISGILQVHNDLPVTQDQQHASLQQARAALDESKKANGPDHEQTVRATDALAGALLKFGDPKRESLALRRTVLDWCVAVFGPSSLDAVRQTYNLGLAHDKLGDYDEAAKLYQAAFSAAENGLMAPGSPELLRILGSLAVVYAAQGNTQKAEEALRVTLAGQQERLGPDHPDTLGARQNAALLAQANGKIELAGQDLAYVLKALEHFLGPEDEATLSTAASLALNLRLRGKHKEAKELFQLALAGQKKALGESHPDVLVTRVMLGELMEEDGKKEEAKKEYVAALEGKKKVWGEKHPDTVFLVKRLKAIG
ncbi:hypothetical protein QBC43DRAFT_273523 [Cladorrhinum sp. PSN259]|nr:hypothetical protein QBC43DRAFT_273523 [Cladorrhinum sp. PSN259]